MVAAIINLFTRYTIDDVGNTHVRLTRKSDDDGKGVLIEELEKRVRVLEAASVARRGRINGNSNNNNNNNNNNSSSSSRSSSSSSSSSNGYGGGGGKQYTVSGEPYSRQERAPPGVQGIEMTAGDDYYPTKLTHSVCSDL